MLTGKINSLLGTINRLKAQAYPKEAVPNPVYQPADTVDISAAAKSKLPLGMAQQAMLDFNSALVETLSASGSDPLSGLYDLTGSPVDRFIRSRFADLNSETKQEFMNLFTTMSQTSGGLVPQQLVGETFGTTGGFPQMINQISQSLNRYF